MSAAANFTPIDNLIASRNKQNTISHPKEFEPPISRMESTQDEVIVDELVEHQVKDPDVASHVEAIKETVEITKELKSHGVESTAVPQFFDYKHIASVIPDEKIIEGQKKPFYSPLRWVSTLALYVLRQAHIRLKLVHGQVVRVLIRQ